MKSAISNPFVVDKYLAKEVALGRVLRPLELEVYPSVHVSCFEVIPKNCEPRKQILTVDFLA